MIKIFIIFFLGVAANASAQVYRCGNTYTQEPCTGGREVDASLAVSDPRGPQTKLIHLCKTQDGQRYWLPEACHDRGWTTDRSERVSIHFSWEDQVAMADRQRRQAQTQTETIYASPPAGQRAVQPAPSGRKAQCDALDERIRGLDSMGRAGSRHYDLDWIRRERKEVRDTQFRIRC